MERKRAVTVFAAAEENNHNSNFVSENKTPAIAKIRKLQK